MGARERPVGPVGLVIECSFEIHGMAPPILSTYLLRLRFRAERTIDLT